jgi:hypothetical protein
MGSSSVMTPGTLGGSRFGAFGKRARLIGVPPQRTGDGATNPDVTSVVNLTDD